MQYFKLTTPGHRQFIGYVKAEGRELVKVSAEYHTIKDSTGIEPAISPATQAQYEDWINKSGNEISPLTFGEQ